MRKFKNFILILCMTVLFVSCSKKDEFEVIRSFEYNFLPEEYEEKYNEVSKNIELEKNKNYKISLKSNCEKGCAEIKIIYKDKNNEDTEINLDAPCEEIISIEKNTTDNIEFRLKINSDTYGNISVDILSD